MAEVKLSVKYGTAMVEVHLPAEATVQQLQEQLEAKTGVFVRRQKLMHKGRVVSGAKGTLAAAGIASGAKLMLLAAGGAVVQSQGAAALAAAQRAKVEQQAARRAEQGQRAQAAAAPPAPATMQARAEVWRKTGIASLRDLKLAAVPPEALAPPLASALRVLDLGGNLLAALPVGLSALAGLQRLRLSLNALEDGGAWEALLPLTQLVVLALDHNRLATVPEGISRLVSLQKLALDDNQIESLPPSLSSLTCLRALSLSANRLAALPPALGGCSRLEEADFSRNQITEIPQELGSLGQLRLLNLDANKVRAIPPALLAGCTALASLSVHDNPITVEVLRETEGYREFDARRKAKYDKQVRMQLHGGGFDEGVDAQEWEHWNP